jgi:hypothetical protein
MHRSEQTPQHPRACIVKHRVNVAAIAIMDSIAKQAQFQNLEVGGLLIGSRDAETGVIDVVLASPPGLDAFHGPGNFRDSRTP